MKSAIYVIRSSCLTLVQSESMRVVRISRPFCDSISWFYLAAGAGLWIGARVIEPSADGAYLPGVWLPSCPLKSFTGIPCPFCGLTTGVVWFVRGDWRAAWNSNILSPFAAVFSIWLVVYALGFRLLAGRALDCELNPRKRRIFLFAGILAAASSWLVNLLRN